MRRISAALAVIVATSATAAYAGPPYLTDDPVPTDLGHWEIYAFGAAEGRRSAWDADVGADLNYGALENVQLTGTLPLSFSNDKVAGPRSGSGDVEVGIKYRFFRDKKREVSAAVFPRVILPTSTLVTAGKTRFLLPLWIGKDFKGGTSLFGGGGYTINPGSGNRDFWQGAVALTHDFGKGVSAGAELTRQGPDVVGGSWQTHAGAGTIVHLAGPASLLLSGGPTWADHQTGYHFYGALGLNF